MGIDLPNYPTIVSKMWQKVEAEGRQLGRRKPMMVTT
jgi:hypothetical protein